MPRLNPKITHFFRTKIFFGPKIILRLIIFPDQKSFHTKFFFRNKITQTKNFFWTKIFFRTKNYFGTNNFFRTKNSKCKLKTCPYCTKTCPHWTCFGSNYLKNGVWLAVTLDKNFNFSKVLLSPKFNYNSISIEVKKKILYYIVYPTLE